MRVDVSTPAGAAYFELDRPRLPSGLLVLTHGAGGGLDAPDLNAVCAAAVQAGIAVARVTQAYRVAGRSSPSAPDKQDEAWLAVIAALRRRRGLASLPMITGGRSNGARVACRTARAAGARGVIALAFPVHPPGKPELSRLPELDGAGVPVLVVQGDRDPFGMPPPAPGRNVIVIGGIGHSLNRDLPSVAGHVIDFVGKLIN